MVRPLRAPKGGKLDAKVSKAKPKMTAELRAAMTTTKNPWPVCEHCGQERVPGHWCEAMRVRQNRIQLGCQKVPEDHDEVDPCISTCSVNPLAEPLKPYHRRIVLRDVG
jgi:hypothetical protein